MTNFPKKGCVKLAMALQDATPDVPIASSNSKLFPVEQIISLRKKMVTEK